MAVFMKARLCEKKNLSEQTCLQTHSLPRLQSGQSGKVLF